MRIEVREESIDLVEYERIPNAFEVTRVLDVAGNADEGFSLTERRLESVPYGKDYDAIPGERPRQWPHAYPALPQEIQLLWYKDLEPRRGSADAAQ